MLATLRLATLDDLPELKRLMHAAISQLQDTWLTPNQIEGSFEFMGLDTDLIRDATYFVAELDGRIAGCGGWSRRETLFGHDQSAGRNPRLLDPKTEPAKIRAMYTDPGFVRRGVGRAVLEACESAARDNGFSRVELAATVAGVPLYETCGYVAAEPIPAIATNGASVPIIRMLKDLPIL